MKKIEVIKGDITKIQVDAVVNAANSALRGGGGVDGAIHRTGGPEIMKECDKIRNRQGGCKTGEAVITTAGDLPAKYVIHTVGPIWNGGKSNESVLLANAYRNSLKIAAEKEIKVISFPNISTGVYGFPKAAAAEIAVFEVNQFLQEHAAIEKVVFVCFDDENYEIYKNLVMEKY